VDSGMGNFFIARKMLIDYFQPGFFDINLLRSLRISIRIFFFKTSKKDRLEFYSETASIHQMCCRTIRKLLDYYRKIDTINERLHQGGTL